MLNQIKLLKHSFSDGFHFSHKASEIGSATNVGLSNTAVSNFDLEETFKSPLCSPRVSTEPVVHSAFITPTEDLNSVTSSESSSSVMVDSALIVEEVLIDIKSGFHWAVGEDFSFNLIWGSS
jgi:hypothetical protein